MAKEPPPPLPPDLLASLEGYGETRDFEADDVLFHEGEASSHLYILLSGELQVFASKNGRELVYSTLHPREYFGELSLDGNPRSASVRAVAPSRCLVIPGDTARTLVRTRPEFAGHLAQYVFQGWCATSGRALRTIPRLSANKKVKIRGAGR